MKNDYDIDLVYLWVEGSDPQWIAKRNLEQAQYTQIENDAVNKCRFCNNDELKYSLRSVEKFAPWINKIFIVTDNQVPAWLDINHPKIKIIDHTEIMPPEALPCFNATALEMRAPYIEGLSERFLYANDDMFFGGQVEKSFFFDKYGMPIIRFQKKVLKETDNLYCRMVKNAQDKIFEEYGVRIKNFPHHNIDAYLKSDYIACLKKFEKDIERTMMSKFRDKDDIQRSIVSYYMLALGRARFKNGYARPLWHERAKIVHRVDSDLPLYKRIFDTLTGNYAADSAYIFPHKIDSCGKKLKKLKPKLFCINDSEDTTDEQRRQIKEFLESYLSEKSGFEIS